MVFEMTFEMTFERSSCKNTKTAFKGVFRRFKPSKSKSGIFIPPSLRKAVKTAKNAICGHSFGGGLKGVFEIYNLKVFLVRSMVRNIVKIPRLRLRAFSGDLSQRN